MRHPRLLNPMSRHLQESTQQEPRELSTSMSPLPLQTRRHRRSEKGLHLPLVLDELLLGPLPLEEPLPRRRLSRKQGLKLQRISIGPSLTQLTRNDDLLLVLPMI